MFTKIYLHADAAKSTFQGLFKLGMRANNNFSDEYFSGLMSLYAERKVRVDNNQLQDQTCDPFVMIEQGLKSNLKSKICPGKLLSN